MTNYFGSLQIQKLDGFNKEKSKKFFNKSLLY